MTVARVEFRAYSIRQRVWWLFVHVPVILACTIIIVWALDYSLRFGLNGPALIWLVLASPMWAFLASLFVAPTVLLIQYLSEMIGASRSAAFVGQVVAVAVLGAVFALATGAMSTAAGAAMGAIGAGFVAGLPVVDPEKHRFRAR